MEPKGALGLGVDLGPQPVRAQLAGPQAQGRAFPLDGHTSWALERQGFEIQSPAHLRFVVLVPSMESYNLIFGREWRPCC